MFQTLKFHDVYRFVARLGRGLEDLQFSEVFKNLGATDVKDLKIP